MHTDWKANEIVPRSAEIQWILESQGPYYFENGPYAFKAFGQLWKLHPSIFREKQHRPYVISQTAVRTVDSKTCKMAWSIVSEGVNSSFPDIMCLLDVVLFC